MTQTLEFTTTKLSSKPGSVLVMYARKGPELLGEASRFWQKTGLDLKRLSTAVKFDAKPGQVLDIPAPNGLEIDRLLVVGDLDFAGEKPPSTTARKEQGGALMSRLSAMRAETVSVVMEGDNFSPGAIAQFAAGLKLRSYKFDRFKTRKKPDDEAGGPEVLRITFHVADGAATDKALFEEMAIVEGTLLARELVNEPSNILGPVEFAERARELAELGIEVEILTANEMSKLQMGALLAVAQGSARPPRMAVMQWHGGAKEQPPIALLGKGVVFDSGGISIKPAGGMEDMKGDMGGAAAVVGTMKSLALRKASANVVGVIGLVENMPDGNAYRPGDIITSMSGQTIEIINTDAEGRLVLADILWYTQDRFKPSAMVDLATLTGAIMVGLGQDYAGLFSNNDDLAAHLASAGLESGEKLWRLPLSPAYDKLIDSRFADMKNTGGRFGGSITAAQFLQRFANDVPWAHLDIAGTAFNSPKNEVNVSWGSGFGAALLYHFVTKGDGA